MTKDIEHGIISRAREGFIIRTTCSCGWDNREAESGPALRAWQRHAKITPLR